MPVQLGAPPQHGFDQPLGLLSDCHRRIEYFLNVLNTFAQPAQPPFTQEQRRVIQSALTYFRTAAPRHNDDEEKSLFPLLRNSLTAAQAMAAIEHLEQDHAQTSALHDEVDRLYTQWLETGDLTLDRKQYLAQTLTRLVEMYRAHIETEDRQIFPLAAQALTSDQLQKVGIEMAQRRGIAFAPRPSSITGNPNMTTKTTIDVRTIPGPQRHPLIFQTFDGLQPGQALEIINDHDPFPLHNQFNMMKKNQFQWAYLQQGPDLWRVQIGKTEGKPAAQ